MVVTKGCGQGVVVGDGEMVPQGYKPPVTVTDEEVPGSRFSVVTTGINTVFYM